MEQERNNESLRYRLCTLIESKESCNCPHIGHRADLPYPYGCKNTALSFGVSPTLLTLGFLA